MTTLPVPSEVLSITELVETILLGVTTHDLLQARRVCREWHSIVHSSLPLRRRLFLAPTVDFTVTRGDLGPRKGFGWVRRKGDQEAQIVTRNPCITFYYGGLSVRKQSHVEMQSIRGLAGGGILEDMFLCMPPTTYARLWVDNPGAGWEVDLEIEEPLGVKIRDVIRATQKIDRKAYDPPGSFRVRVLGSMDWVSGEET